MEYTDDAEWAIYELVKYNPKRYKCAYDNKGKLVEAYDTKLNGLWKRTNIGWIWFG